MKVTSKDKSYNNAKGNKATHGVQGKRAATKPTIKVNTFELHGQKRRRREGQAMAQWHLGLPQSKGERRSGREKQLKQRKTRHRDEDQQGVDNS